MTLVDADSPVMAGLRMPSWARVGERRLDHIVRVTSLIDAWAAEMSLAPEEAGEWHDAGAWHDALRDATADELKSWTPGLDWPIETLHGPAAAARLESEGESRRELLEAIRWHTIGSASWGRTGRALYMADFLEPGRSFEQDQRSILARAVPGDFQGVFRQVVRLRIEWNRREGKPVFPNTAELWNEVA